MLRQSLSCALACYGADERDMLTNTTASRSGHISQAGQFFIRSRRYRSTNSQALTRWKKYPGVYTAAVVLGAMSGGE
jgi:hypothetical protein